MSSSLPTYPLLILPERLREYLKTADPPQKSESISQKIEPFTPTVKKRGVSPRRLRFLFVLWSNAIYCIYFVIAMSFAYQAVFHAVDRDLFVLWGLVALGVVLLQWLGGMVLGYLYAVAVADEREYERQYWLHNQRNNEIHRQQQQQQMRRRRSAVAKSILQQRQQQRRSGSISLAKSEGASDSLRYQEHLVRGEIKGEAPKGVSEAHLAKYLERYFSNCQICEEYFAIEGTKVGYTTDFSIIEPQTGIGIDLEVDEPYEGRTKQPHHCTDVKSDRLRNEYLLERGWIILRVSEYQVVSQPESVCKLIAQVLYRFTANPDYLDPLLEVSDLTSDLMWNSAEAQRMVNAKYRERYLDRYGIFAYDPAREERNLAQYKAQRQQAAKESLKRRRKYRKSKRRN